MGLFELINLGGPINWILFGLLCVCLSHWIERCIYFFQTSEKSKKSFLKELEKKCSETKKMTQEDKRNFLEKHSARVYFEMNRGLWFMNFVGAIAPSIGLLGTVVGLISSFHNLSQGNTQMNIQDLSGGIWVAMLTTATGMVVSIPSLFFYRIFKRLIEKRMYKINLLIEENCR